MESGKGMTLIVKTITRLTVGLILLYGIYIVLHGHITPGGGFAGGVIVALSFVHLFLAFGKEKALARFPKNMITVIETLGGLLFITVAGLGLMKGNFFYNFFRREGVEFIGEKFTILSAGIIPLCNLAICLKVGAGLFGIFVALVLFTGITRNPGQREEKEG